ncbi:unnamed protein product [Penicillium nalgiovense]|nr:unnamed protein product [Penicillium nalgiovense]
MVVLHEFPLHDPSDSWKMPDHMMQQDALKRNRAPCGNCKSSKRKCDRVRSRCSRCRNQNLECVPSTTARWRVENIASASQRIQAHRPSKSEQIPPGGVLSNSDEAPGFHLNALPHSATQLSPPDVVPDNDLDICLAIDDSPSFPDIDDIVFRDFGSLQNAFVSPSQVDDLNLCQSMSAHAPEVEFQFRAMSFLNEPTLNDRSLLTPCATSYLWQEFVQSIAPGISIDNQQHENQVTKYLASYAEGRPSLFSAIIFLSYSIKLNWMLQNPVLIDMTEITAAGLKMEEQAVSYIADVMSRDGDQSTGHDMPQSSHRLTTLATLVALCSAYIAANNLQSLRVCQGHAMRVTREGFTTDLATDECFLFLVRWLGYIHIVALMDETDYSIDAPNYFCITAKPNYGHSARGEFFQDVDPFFGISVSVVDILYRIGCILRTRKNNPPTFLSDSWKSDASCVEMETRMQLLLRRLKNHKKDKELVYHLDHYNESLLYSGFLRFLLEVKEEAWNSSLVQSAVSQILDSCAAVPADTPVAKLMLLPMFTAGSCTTRPLYHDFIRGRLEVLRSGLCIVNVTELMEVLEERWREQKKTARCNYMRSSINMSHSLTPDLELKQASVCVLF